MASKSYPDEFKIEAVRQVTDRGYKPKDVAERLGFTTKSIHNWMNQFGSKSVPQVKLSEQDAEIKKLKAELCRVTEERNILKEAAVYFAGESKKSTRS
jgi:transposase-like protein